MNSPEALLLLILIFIFVAVFLSIIVSLFKSDPIGTIFLILCFTALGYIANKWFPDND